MVTGMEQEWMDLGAIGMAVRGKKISPDGYGIPTPASTGFRTKGKIYLGTHTARNGLLFRGMDLIFPLVFCLHGWMGSTDGL